MNPHHPLLKKAVLWLLTMIVLAACAPTEDEAAAPPATIAAERPAATLTVVEKATATPIAGDVLIRIYNQTGLDLETISVQFPSQTEDYGSLANGTSSDFHIIHEAYRYAFIQVNSGDQAYVLQPIDYVGETLLAPGKYTYGLRRSGPNLTLDLIEGDESLPMQPSLEVVTMYVSAETADCVGVAPQTCLLVKFAPDDEWQLFYDTIAGFIHQPGYEYALIVYKLTYDNPPADASAIQYKLAEYVDVTAVPDSNIPETTDKSESIVILSPGSLSQITSPVVVSGESDFPFEGTLELQVVFYNGRGGVDGTAVVGTGFAMLNGEFGERSSYEGTVEFESPSEPTPGRVIVTSTSPRDGHIDHLASVPVTLLPAGGTAVINPATPQPEAIAIDSPTQGDDISGGTIHITGFAAPTFEQNLVIEILDEQGAVVGSGFTTIAASMGESGSFEADIAYSVAAQTTGAVCVQDVNALDGGLIHRTCATVQLLP